MKTVLLAYERDQDLAAVESVLQARGHRVLKARSGVEALDLVRNQTPDAIVSDVLLPRMDGFALCRRLREDPDTRPSSPNRSSAPTTPPGMPSASCS